MSRHSDRDYKQARDGIAKQIADWDRTVGRQPNSREIERRADEIARRNQRRTNDTNGRE
jgi:hypothetical protein